MAANHEPTWLVAAVDQRMAQFKHQAGPKPPFLGKVDVIFMTLTDPPEETPQARMRWEYSCDNCDMFMNGQLIAETVEREAYLLRVLIQAGACARCWELP